MMKLTPEDRFRNTADDLPPMVPAQFIVGPRIDGRAYAGYGWLAVILAAGILCIALALIQSAGAQQPPPYDDIDAAFERHVETETKALCKFEWRLGRSSMVPERAMICKRGRG